MKIFSTITLFLLLAMLTAVHAQTSAPARKVIWTFDAAISPGISLQEGRLAIGADFQVSRNISDKVSVTFDAGFTHFRQDSYRSGYIPAQGAAPIEQYYRRDQNLIPITVGLKALLPNSYYIAGGAGIGIDINGNSSRLLSITVGKKITERLDIELKYENYRIFSSADRIAFRVAYRLF